jgi:hypothetical protein
MRYRSHQMSLEVPSVAPIDVGLPADARGDAAANIPHLRG